ncbi:MAG: TIGR02186 family protein [Devosia sp.]|uniref:TIGR02186 family protein n=1 Tax=Devosia sp. TaxID=1871048 RepID=UPI0024C9030A|nr:TIGR02186 family protein [Devosia sp.]UYN98573.1 MAG: TIGR02186 family protein [Devosia sp.]
MAQWYRILWICLLFLLPSAAMAQVEVVLTNSDPVVAVHSNFRGQAVTLFGSITPAPPADAPYAVVVVVQGPSTDWVVREKQRQFGFVLNAASARYDQVPAYYGIFSTSPLSQVLDPAAPENTRFDLAALAASLRDLTANSDFDAEFVRLMQGKGRFSQAERGVTMLSDTAFSLRVPIESNATNGLYLARAYVIGKGQVLGETTTRFTVRTQGFERYVADLARFNPPLYGLAAVLIALATGWLGGVLFRR